LHGMQEVRGSTPLFSTSTLRLFGGFFIEHIIQLIYRQSVPRSGKVTGSTPLFSTSTLRLFGGFFN